MKTKLLLLCALVIAWAVPALGQGPTDPPSYEYHPNLPLVLGQGFDPNDLLLKRTCFEWTQVDQSGAAEGKFRLTFVRTTAESETASGLDARASLRLPKVRGNVSISRRALSKTSSDDIVVSLYYDVRFTPQQVSPKLLPFADALVQEGKKTGNWAKFFETCGSRYVKKVIYGGRAVATITLRKASREDIQMLSRQAGLRGGLGPVRGSGAISVSRMARQAQTEGRFSIELEGRGGDLPGASTKLTQVNFGDADAMVNVQNILAEYLSTITPPKPGDPITQDLRAVPLEYFPGRTVDFIDDPRAKDPYVWDDVLEKGLENIAAAWDQLDNEIDELERTARGETDLRNLDDSTLIRARDAAVKRLKELKDAQARIGKQRSDCLRFWVRDRRFCTNDPKPPTTGIFDLYPRRLSFTVRLRGFLDGRIFERSPTEALAIFRLSPAIRDQELRRKMNLRSEQKLQYVLSIVPENQRDAREYQVLGVYADGREQPIAKLSASTSETVVSVVGLTSDNIVQLERQYRTKLEVPWFEVDGKRLLGLEQVFVTLYCAPDSPFPNTMVIRTRDSVGQASTVQLVEIRTPYADPARCVTDPNQNMTFNYTI
jgi:hypothetical protein